MQEDYPEEQNRELRSKQILHMIHNYRPTQKDIKTLQKMKKQTVMEINLRYLACQRNHQYQFPKMPGNQFMADEDQPYGEAKNYSQIYQAYDLYQQASLDKKMPTMKLFQAFDSTRRVKSLESQRIHSEEKRIINNLRRGAINLHPKRQIDNKFSKKNSAVDQRNIQSSLQLPALKRKQLSSKNLKSKKFDMEKVIGKKIRTEASSPIHSNSKNSKNFNKIHLEAIREPKKFFLKQL